MRLLVERVRDVEPGFEVTSENAQAVGELCRRLDGLPLALELAAAWMRLLTPQQMLAGLYERLDRPGALADLPGRQQTLTDTIEWSYDLLPAPARQLLARLSVFAAPFTTGAAEAVCGQDGADAVAGLSTLLDHSMLSPASRPDGQRAFRLLDPIRRFAAARLENADETLARLERYLLDVLKTAGATHGSQDRDLRQLDSEQPNLQAVLGWLAARGRPVRPAAAGPGRCLGLDAGPRALPAHLRAVAADRVTAGRGAAHRPGPAGEVSPDGRQAGERRRLRRGRLADR